MEHKTAMNILKLTNRKKMNSNSLTEHKTDMNITEQNTDHDIIQNRHESY